ncbi:MAG: rhomboid family intramembrane serine protease [Bacteroidota bacterium]
MAFNSYGNQQISPVVLNLIIINVLVYLAQTVSGGTDYPNPTMDLFALHHYKSELFKPHQVVTHMFMHGGFFHLLFNMFALWMFGTQVENVWGPKRFLIFYFICGLGSAFTQLGSYAYDFWQIDQLTLSQSQFEGYQTILAKQATVGASGAIMGVLAAFGYLFPNTEMIIIPIPVPIKAKWAIMGMIALDVFGGVVKVQGDNVAHFAHIGGAAIGFLLVLFWNKTNKKSFY